MALLKAIYDSIDDVPEEYKPLYAEKDGKAELSEVEGFKTQADIDRLNGALVKERNDHKAVKDALGVWGDLKHDEVVTALDRIPELEAAAEGKGIDEEKMSQLVEARLRTRIAPIERENATLKTQVGEQGEIITGYQQSDRRRKIHDNVRTEGVKLKVIDTAMDDALLLAERVFEIREDDGAIVTRDNVGVTPGLTATDWFAEMQEKRPHWWPASQGGGAGGGGTGGGGIAGNPWTKENWNMTKQGQVIKEKGRERADQMAKAAGVHVGATQPAK